MDFNFIRQGTRYGVHTEVGNGATNVRVSTADSGTWLPRITDVSRLNTAPRFAAAAARCEATARAEDES